jgi:UDPglucose 6-dehydrogenase
MKLGVIGYGVVGDALVYALQKKGFDGEFVIIDPQKSDRVLHDVKETDMAFICVPTPALPSGAQDISIMRDVCTQLQAMGYCGTTIIKSTTTPTHISYLQHACPGLTFVTNPEFLTQRTARADYLASPHIVIGGTPADCEPLVRLYLKYWPDSKYTLVSLQAGMFIKYMLNSFFATKVSFMNEMNALWAKLGSGNEWDNIIDGIRRDGRVADSHLLVPGPDGKPGFGGKCFPKDLQALVDMAVAAGTPANVLRGALRTNRVVRGA